MAKTKVTKKVSEAPEFEEGIFNLKLVKTEDVTGTFGGESKDQIKWTFEPTELIGSEENPVTKVIGYTSLSYFEGNESLSPAKLYLWSRALKVEPEEDENGDLFFDFEPVYGSVVAALVEKNTRGWPTLKKIYKIVSDARANKAEVDAAAETAVAGLTGEKSEEAPVEVASA